MAIGKKKRGKIFQTGRTLLGLQKGQLSDELKNKLLKKYRKNGALGVGNFLNRVRGNRGMERLDLNKVNTLRGIRSARSGAEKTAWQGANKTYLPEFDPNNTRQKELENEYGDFYNQETTDLGKHFDYQNEDFNTSQERGYQDYDTKDASVTQDETYGNEDYTTNTYRLAADLAANQKSRAFQEADENRNYNISLGQSGNSSLSPTAQRLAERLRERQQFRATEAERGFSQQGQDLSTGQSRFAANIAEQRRLLGQGRTRFGEDLTTGRTRLGESRDIFKRQRRQGFQNLIGKKYAEEQSDFYNQQ